MSDRNELVRVRDDLTGHHVSISAGKAERDAARYRLLDEPAVDRNGRALPAKILHRARQAPADETVVTEPVQPQRGPSKPSGKASENSTTNPEETP